MRRARRLLPRWVPVLTLVFVLAVALPMATPGDEPARSGAPVLDLSDDRPTVGVTTLPPTGTLLVALFVVAVVALTAVPLRPSPTARWTRLRAPPELSRS